MGEYFECGVLWYRFEGGGVVGSEVIVGGYDRFVLNGRSEGVGELGRSSVDKRECGKGENEELGVVIVRSGFVGWNKFDIG